MSLWRSGWIVRLVAALFAAAAFGLLGDSLSSRAVVVFDAAGTTWVQALRSDWVTPIMKAITYTGSFASMVPLLAVIAIALLWRRRYADAAVVVTVVAIGDRLTDLFKNLYERARPEAAHALVPLPDSFAFPSGHATSTMCLAAVVAVVVIGRSHWSRLTKRMLVMVLITWTVLVALSRVYLGVHHPTDIVGAWLLAAAWLGVVSLAAGRQRREELRLDVDAG